MYNISKKRTKQIFHNILVIMFMTQGVLKILILYTLPFYFTNFLYIYIYIYIYKRLEASDNHTIYLSHWISKLL